MIEEVKRLFDDYLVWLKGKTTFKEMDNWVEITTPYLDRHNDYLQIYARKEGQKILLTDDGYTISDLIQSGCKIDSKKRKDLLQITLNGFGVVQDDSHRLQVSASSENFGRRKHDLLQAMLAVNDLFYLAEPIVASLFYEDVVSWLDQNDVRYTSNIKFTGKTGYDHLFDFVIPKSRQQNERIIKTINKPNKDTAQALAFAWIDTKEVRPTTATAYAVLNDKENLIPNSVTDALTKYDVKPLLWSKRQQYVGAFKA